MQYVLFHCYCRFRVTQPSLIDLNLVDLAADLSGATYRQSWPLCPCRFHSSLPCRSVHGGGDEAVFCVESGNDEMDGQAGEAPTRYQGIDSVR